MTEQKPTGLIAIDAEYTGPDDKNNKVISVGIVSMTTTGEDIMGTRISFKLPGLDNFSHASVKKYWQDNGFSANAFDEFWKNNLGPLKFIQTETTAEDKLVSVFLETDEAAFAKRVRQIYDDHINRFEVVTGLTDTCIVDGYCLNNLLLTHDEIPWHYKKGHNYISYENVDSFLRGVLQMGIDDTWSVFDAKQTAELYPLMADVPFLSCIDHLPEVDACNTAFKYIAGHKLGFKLAFNNRVAASSV